MQDAELFFQAADHRHLFLYLDGLAETEARRQTDVCNYARKRLDDYEALQKKVERLKQELQQEAARRQADADDYAALQKKVERLKQELQHEKDACAFLQTQLAQQGHITDLNSRLLAMADDRQTGTQARLCSEMAFLYRKFHSTRTFPLLRKASQLLAVGARKKSARQQYLHHLGIEDMDQILLCAQSASETLETLDAFSAQYFSPIPALRQFFTLVAGCLNAADERKDKKNRNRIQTFLNEMQILEQKILKDIKQQQTSLAKLLSVASAFLTQDTKPTSGATDNELANFIYAEKPDALARNTPNSRKSAPGAQKKKQR